MTNERKYAFLMIRYEMPDFIKKLQDDITDKELYVEDGEYGKETETHVTLVPCLSNDVKVEELKPYLDDLSKYNILLTDISKFSNENYDVLKCNVASMNLHDTNNKICKDFEIYSQYKDNYRPHVTIAYLKKGMADKYLKKFLDKSIILKPISFEYSWWEDDEMKKVSFKK